MTIKTGEEERRASEELARKEMKRKREEVQALIMTNHLRVLEDVYALAHRIEGLEQEWPSDAVGYYEKRSRLDYTVNLVINFIVGNPVMWTKTGRSPDDTYHTYIVETFKEYERILAYEAGDWFAAQKSLAERIRCGQWR